MPLFPHACCCLCGGAIVGDAEGSPWMRDIRAIFAVDTGAEAHAFISGRGRRHEFSDTVELPAEADTPALEAVDLLEDGTVEITLMRTTFEYPAGFFDQPPTWGYPFHAACWEILSRFDPDLVNGPEELRSLLLLCRSFPIQEGLINWGHDYGGSAHRDTESALAPGGEPRLHYRDPGSLAQDEDPLDIPSIYEAFLADSEVETTEMSTSEVPKSPEPSRHWEHQTRENGHDRFVTLPPELLSWILINLTSADVVSLRRASYAFASLPLPDAFWKSRFLPERDFPHIFEAQQRFSLAQYKGHWKSIYSKVKSSSQSLAVVNRRRIWNLCFPLVAALKQMRGSVCQGRAVRSFFEPDAPAEEDPGRTWFCASRALKKRIDSVSTGSRVLHERRLDLPLIGCVSIFLSTIDLFGRQYVSGMRIVDKGGISSSLGYTSPERETRLVFAANLEVRGFCLAQDECGVRGFAITLSDGTMSNWCGDNECLPKRMLLPGTSADGRIAIECLQCGFDGVKMVSVKISGQSEHRQKDDCMPRFRNTVTWYPDVPGPSFSFPGTTGRLYGLNLDLPVCFTIFAASVDKLADVRGIQVRTRAPHFGHGGDTLWSIVPSPSSLPIEGVLLLNPDNGETDKHYFEIDGKGGERITGMETSYAADSLEGFKMHTNHGRTFECPRDYENATSSRLRATRSVSVAQDQAFVGFWGILDAEVGILDMGLVVTGLNAN